MTNWTARQLDVPLTFLGEGNYTAEVYEDADDADKYSKNARVLKKTVTAKSPLHLKLAPGGGYAAQFVPAGA